MDKETATICPKCSYPSRRFDVCESCGALINRIRNRQGTGSIAVLPSEVPGDELVRASALAYESPVSTGMLIKALLLVVLLGGGFIVLKHYQAARASPASRYVRQFDQSMFDSEVVNATAGETWVVDFFATWCGPCKKFAPEFEATADKFGGKVSFARVDVDSAPAVAQRYRIESIPSVIMFQGGRVVAQTGGMSRDDFENWVKANL
ncbi:MAG: thioredoxin family protein [Candidatus Sumerlaeaceae bacterium]